MCARVEQLYASGQCERVHCFAVASSSRLMARASSTSRLGHPAGVMAGQPEVDAVPDAGELRVVIDLLGVQRDPGQEAERLAEILELERPEQRLAAVPPASSRPGIVHVVRRSLEMPLLQAQLGRKGD